MEKTPVIGLSGVIASGKSTVALNFSEEMGWKYVSFGDYVRKVTSEKGFDPQNRKILQEIGSDLINNDLEGFCKNVLSQADWKSGEPLIIDGIRHVEVKLMLEKLVSPYPFILVYLYVSDDIRIRNLSDEGRTDLSQLKELERDSTERQVRDFLPEAADYILNGDKPWELLLEDLKTILQGGAIKDEVIFADISLEHNLQKPRTIFDPNSIRIESKLLSIDYLLTKTHKNIAQLASEFSRKVVWNDFAKSRLIESVILRISLNAVYIDATDEEDWRIIDGLQRLDALSQFINGNVNLTGLDYLTQFENKVFAELPKNIQRRILETQINVCLFESDSLEIKFEMFRRINTGSLPLSTQEIRHTLYNGRAALMLAELASSAYFKEINYNKFATERMRDRECVLRFIAFTITPYTEYKSSDFENFLNETMSKLNNMNEIEIEFLAQQFLQAVKRVFEIFGKNALRLNKNMSSPINRALFEVWTVLLGKLAPENANTLIRHKDRVSNLFRSLLLESSFKQSISVASYNESYVKLRFERVEMLISEVLNDSAIKFT